MSKAGGSGLPLNPPKLSGFKRPIIDLAPDVVEEVDVAYQNTGVQEINANLKVDELYAPSVGPANPWKAADLTSRNVHTGRCEDSYLNPYIFEQQLRQNNRGMFDDWRAKKRAKNPTTLAREKAEEQARKEAAAAGEEGVEVTAGGEVVQKDAAGGAVVPVDAGALAAVDADGKTDEENYLEGHTFFWEENRRGERTRKVHAKQPEFFSHVDKLFDYQGRSILFDPPHRNVATETYPPKKLVHTYRGHNKGVHCVRWLPPQGHMFASGGLEGKVKLWDTFTAAPIHTYFGHTHGIKDLAFNNDGTTFVTSGYDSFMREWDTETGKVLGSYTLGAIGNCVKYHPDENRQNEFFVGCADKQLHQFDTRTGKIIRSYDQHLGPVNSCTFIDNNRKIVTTSDDKTMRVWEMDLPVTVKQVFDPGMHSMPSATIHPSGNFFGLQSMDNQILIYSASDKFALNKKKRFTGHLVAGYACEVGFSHDGRYVSSGNGDGELFVWSWGSCKIVKHYKCHDKVLISHLWHPTDSSKLLTCSWDGTVKLWD